MKKSTVIILAFLSAALMGFLAPTKASPKIDTRYISVLVYHPSPTLPGVRI